MHIYNLPGQGENLKTHQSSSSDWSIHAFPRPSNRRCYRRWVWYIVHPHEGQCITASALCRETVTQTCIPGRIVCGNRRHKSGYNPAGNVRRDVPVPGRRQAWTDILRIIKCTCWLGVHYTNWVGVKKAAVSGTRKITCCRNMEMKVKCILNMPLFSLDLAQIKQMSCLYLQHNSAFEYSKRSDYSQTVMVSAYHVRNILHHRGSRQDGFLYAQVHPLEKNKCEPHYFYISCICHYVLTQLSPYVIL